MHANGECRHDKSLRKYDLLWYIFVCLREARRPLLPHKLLTCTADETTMLNGLEHMPATAVQARIHAISELQLPDGLSINFAPAQADNLL
jgi:hypothetical protein